MLNSKISDIVASCRGFEKWKNLHWIILIAAGINVVFIGGKRRCFGLFITAMHNRSFSNTSMAEFNWIGDSYSALAFSLMPFVTSAILFMDRAYRLSMFAAAWVILISGMTSSVVPDASYLFMTHTILHGVGSSLVLCTTALIVGEYFNKTHRFHVLATTFVSGGPFGALIFCPFYTYCIKEYGWRNAFRIIAVLFLIENLISFVLFKAKDLEETQLDQDREFGRKKGIAFCTWQHLKLNPQIGLWLLERIFHNIIMYGLAMNLADYVTDKVQNLSKGSAMSLTFAGGETITFLIGALTGDKVRGHLAKIYAGGSLCLFITMFAWTFQHENLDVGMAFAFIAGLCIGVANTMLYATSEEITLLEGGISYPMTKMMAGVGMIIAPLFSGLVIDKNRYKGFFISLAVIAGLRFLCLLGITIILRSKESTTRLEVESAEMETGTAMLPIDVNEKAMLSDADMLESDKIRNEEYEY